LRILVVDDHAVVRRGVRSLLESHEGWEVCGEATTGRHAVEQSRRLRPDVVVMDLSLPELNGLDATRQILKDAPETEVLVLTMHHSEVKKDPVAQDWSAQRAQLRGPHPAMTPGEESVKFGPYMGRAGV
jgi:DNA-binding NarL/FixJ family response regulator